MSVVEDVRGVLVIMGPEGDTKKMWNKDNMHEVEDARRSFNDLRKKGFLAYTVDKEGNKGKLIREFDPELEKIIMSPPMAGG